MRHLQDTDKKDSAQRNLFSQVQLQIPDHGYRHAQNEEISDKRQKSVGKRDSAQGVGNTVAFLVLVPEIGHRCAFKRACTQC